MTQASMRRDAVNPALQLEASGGVNLDTITPISRTGVDRISVGGLTHSATVLDVAMDVEA
jgi:nicotinate-nucleotide pyrophosphorylase (carboxylating)